ncbi:hypothetical protein [Falsiruegeria mediterranea]|jgi:hypothetical protein|uniref:Uncharacterized protein n=1 Tax=Falsiruegeria mediterranea M17 TaxID=1200281 RepID=A0A2R8C337_9RHOB|nr:hypothetical protein [Falsiruegeria mediterranea]SPJ26753.1 hypothetical protein TRM7615_00221 [Falsiruegeria mediterranea M17]
MAQADIGGTLIEDGILDLLRQERTKALSAREWKFRIAGFGYAIKDVRGSQIVTKLPQGTELGVLPAQFA